MNRTDTLVRWSAVFPGLAAGEYRCRQPLEDPPAWGCGFTQPYTPEAAGQWADAMPVPGQAIGRRSRFDGPW